MVETSTCSKMAESDATPTAMKETLRAQQQLLQKLYAELDQEREASSTAASEALDMILRLQGEKAAVKMEAIHYKRMAEEKIGHAEVTLEVYEELFNEKEMEIASLEFQVLAYKHKLLALGIDLNASEFEFPEDLLLNKIDQQNGENDQSGNIRRLSSLPPLPSKHPLRATRKRGRSPSPAPVPVSDVSPKLVGSNANDHELTSPSLDLQTKSVDYAYGTLDSYWDQIRSLDEKVKVISDSRESGAEKSPNLRTSRGRSCSILLRASAKVISEQTEEKPSINSDKVNHGEGMQDREAIASPACSVSVHDVFEVPQTREKHSVSELGKKRLEKWNSDTQNRLTKPDSVSEEMVESHVKHDKDKLKSKLSSHLEIKIPSPRDMKTIILQKKEGMDVDVEFYKLHQRIERLERERTSIRQEVKHEGDREEQLRLLQDIHCQLKLIQSEMRSWKTKQTKPKDDVPLDPLREAMLYFWF